MTLYGIVDASYGQMTATTAAGVKSTIKGISSQQSVSRIGFRGEEDLGGGLKANFTLEYYIEPDNGSGIGAGTATGTASTARQAFAGISGGFGSVNVGNQTTLIALTNGTSDFHGGVNTVGYAAGNNQNSRRSNMIQYTTPSFNGFSASAQFGYKGTANTTDGNSTAVRVAYANGPLTVAAATETTKKTSLEVATFGNALNTDFANVGRTANELGNASADRKRNAYGATYDLGVAKVGFTHSDAKAGTDLGKYVINSVGVSVPMGAWTLNATTDSGKQINSGAASEKLSAYQLSAYYALSKRTNLYAITGQVKNKATTAKDSQYAIGLRHQF